MFDDNIGNAFAKFLEDIIKRQDAKIKELEADNAAMSSYLSVTDDLIDGLYEEIDEMSLELLAVCIQAAEAEYRADEEKRKRIALLMRI